MAEAARHRRSPGATARHPAAGRAHQPSRPGRHRMAGGASPIRVLRLRRRQPRPLLPGERRDCHGRTEPRLSGRTAARHWQLQQASGGERSVPARPGQAPGSAGKSSAPRDRVAAARTQGTHFQVQSSHRQGAATHRRTGRLERAHPHRQRRYRFFRHRPKDPAADRVGSRQLRYRRPHALRGSRLRPYRRHACRPGRAQRQRQDHSAAAALARTRAVGRRDTYRRCAAGRLLRSEPRARS